MPRMNRPARPGARRRRDTRYALVSRNLRKLKTVETYITVLRSRTVQLIVLARAGGDLIPRSASGSEDPSK